MSGKQDTGAQRHVRIHRRPKSGERRRQNRLALAFFTAWIAATFLSGWVGIWFSVGTISIALGLTAALVAPETLRAEFRTNGRLVMLGVVGGLLMIAATYTLYPLARWLVPSVVTQSAALYATFGGAAGPKVWVLLPLVVLGEEIVWRGVVQRPLLLALGPIYGTLAAAGIYSLSVLAVGSWLLIGIAVGCGLYWSILRTYSRSLVPVLIAHLSWDICVFVLFPLR